MLFIGCLFVVQGGQEEIHYVNVHFIPSKAGRQISNLLRKPDLGCRVLFYFSKGFGSQKQVFLRLYKHVAKSTYYFGLGGVHNLCRPIFQIFGPLPPYLFTETYLVK